jgi:azurin
MNEEQTENDPSNVSRRDFLQRLGLFGVAGIGATSLLAGCGGGSSEKEGASSASSESSSAAAGTQSSGGNGDVAKTVTIHPKGNQMKYKETEFTVPAGKKVKLVFENTASSPSMQHNVVIAASGSTGLLKKIGQAGTQAGSTNDYVPQEGDLTNQILAHTPIAKPGETVSVTFTTPSESGEYGYVCTYPGHWATMQGTMIVKG